MKTITQKNILIAVGFFSLNVAVAHDPSMHNKEPEKPKCQMIEDMDHSDMSQDDPVMQAMMKKCMTSHKGEGEDHSSTQAADEEQLEADKYEH